MINNNLRHWGLLLGLLGAGCRRGDPAQGAWQGIVEYEERALAFEISGRVARIAVEAGQQVKPGDVIAELDATLARTAYQARQSEAQAARDQLSLLRAGARGQDVRAMRARVEAATASETLSSRSAERMRALAAAGSTTAAALDESEAQLLRARAERQAVQENLSALASGARKQELLVAEHRLAASEAGAQLELERLERHTLRAQHAGEVLEVHLEASEMAPAGAPIATVAEVARPYAEVFVPQAALGDLRAGAPVSARIDGSADAIAGTVELVRRRAEFTPRFLFSQDERSQLVTRVRVRLDDRARRLHAGVPIFVRAQASAVAAGARP